MAGTSGAPRSVDCEASRVVNAREAHEALYSLGFTTTQADFALCYAWKTGFEARIKVPAFAIVRHDASGYTIKTEA